MRDFWIISMELLVAWDTVKLAHSRLGPRRLGKSFIACLIKHEVSDVNAAEEADGHQEKERDHNRQAHHAIPQNFDVTPNAELS